MESIVYRHVLVVKLKLLKCVSWLGCGLSKLKRSLPTTPLPEPVSFSACVCVLESALRAHPRISPLWPKTPHNNILMCI